MRIEGIDRREFVRRGLALAGGSALATGTTPARSGEAASSGALPPRKFRLGMVTYMLGAKMDIPTLLRTCKETGVEGLELRTTHAHGVEPALSPDKRRDVKKQFEDSGVALWGLGSVCEFHSPDPAVVRKNIETCGEFCKLAKDIGARGVKVRPNSLPKDVPVEKTLQQIGKALAECGKMADDNGVEIWLEVHGSGTSNPAHIRTIMEVCGHPKVGACWNSNLTEVKDGSIKEPFTLLSKWLLSCHINDLFNQYPWRELFDLMRLMQYDRFTLAEMGKADDSDPVGTLKKYRQKWVELTS